MKIDTQALISAGNEEMSQLLPVQYACAPDLVNRTPTDLTHRADGGRIAGSILANDIYPGSASPAVWMYALPLMVAAVVAAILGSLALTIGTWVPIIEMPRVFMESKLSGASVVNSIGITLLSTYFGFIKFNFLAWLPVLAMAVLGWLVIAEQEATRDSYRWYWYGFVALSAMILFPIFGTLVVMAVFGARIPSAIKTVLALLSPIIGPLAIVAMGLMGIFTPRLVAWGLERARQSTLKDATEDTKASSVSALTTSQNDKRQKQAELSLLDPSPFITIGRSKGYLRKAGYSLTPDPGAVMGLTVHDLGTHELIFGKTGKGKTEALKRQVRAWAENNCGGLYAADPGKYSFPRDIKEFLHVLVTPEMNLNILAGMDVPLAATTIYEVLADNAKKGGTIWDKSIEYHARAALYVLEEAQAVPRLRPVVHQSFRHLEKMLAQDQFRAEIISCLPPARSEATQWARDYWTNVYPCLPDETKQSFAITLIAALSPLVGTESIGKWVGNKSDIDIPKEVVNGLRVGLVYSKEDGLGALLVATLVRRAYYAKLMERKGVEWRRDWTKDNAEVATFMDEASAGADEADAEHAKIARSLGNHMVFGTQNLEGLNERLGTEMACKAFHDNFETWMVFESSEDTYEAAIKKLEPINRWMPDKEKAEGAPLLTALKANQNSGLANHNRGHLRDTASSVTGFIAGIKRNFSVSTHAQQDQQNPIRKSSTLNGKYELAPAISLEELKAIVREPYLCLFIPNRAKGPRPEIADTEDKSIRLSTPIPTIKEPPWSPSSNTL